MKRVVCGISVFCFFCAVQAEPLLDRGALDRLMNEGQYAQVVATVAAQYRGDENSWLLPYLGTAEFYRGNYKNAIHYFKYIPAFQRSREVESLLAWAYYYSGDQIAAKRVFRANLRKNSQSVDALSGIGWSYYAQGFYPEARSYFQRALQVSPGDIPTKKGLDYCNAWIAVGDKSDELMEWDRRYTLVRYFGTYSTYVGDTVKKDGLEHDLMLSTGQVGKNYLNLMLTHVNISSLDGFFEFKQSEIRASGGVYVGQSLLLRGLGGFFDLDDTPLEGAPDTGVDVTAWMAGVGAETLGWKVNLFADLYGFVGTDAGVYQVVPGLAWNLWDVKLRSALVGARSGMTGQDGQTTAYFQQSALWSPTVNTSLYGGFGVGESYYGLRTPGGVFYNLPDKRLVDAWLQWSIDFEPWVFSVGVSFAQFETAALRQYEAYNTTLSIGRSWGKVPR